jgi:hypothetical protein
MIVKQAIKYGLILVILPIVAVYVGNVSGFKISRTADQIAAKAAGDDIAGALSLFTKAVIKKSTLTNDHPYYLTQIVEEQEKDYYSECKDVIEIKGLFRYYKHNDQDYLIMKKAAKDCKGETLKLELSTAFTTDAEDYCDNKFNANIWNDELKKVFKNKILISNKSGELTQDNDSEASHFRCVIMPDTIQDELDD